VVANLEQSFRDHWGRVLAALIGFLGLVLLIIFLVFLFGGRLHPGVQCGSSAGGRGP